MTDTKNIANSEESDEYQKSAMERKAYVDAILNDTSRKKTVVAGPGTGKTFLFKSLLREDGNNLTLTFVNSLVEDLSLDLCDLSIVKTLHGFARGVLGSRVKVFPKLSKVIEEDTQILKGERVDYDAIFNKRDDGNPNIEFFKVRKKYYDNFYGYSSIVYAAVMYFSGNKSKIPIFDQIVVDEFQDFNALEVSLIDLLAEKSPILLAGDDDQALYSFKDASATYIRDRHHPDNSTYTSFTLPFCSRCTRVIVNSVNDLIDTARQKSLLNGRIFKDFRYFADPEKDKESAQYDKLIYSKIYPRQVPWLIQKQLEETAKEIRGVFSCLIIAPTKTQCAIIASALRKNGLRSVETVDSSDDKDVTLLDGYRLLLQDDSLNLGWRIVAKHLLSKRDFEEMLQATQEDLSNPICEHLSQDLLKSTRKMLKILKKIEKGEPVSESEQDESMSAIGIDGAAIKSLALREKVETGPERIAYPGLRKIPIKVTTIQSSKGLAADVVFISYFDDRFFIKSKNKEIIADQDVCNLIVALTRAKKKVYLVSSDLSREPTFLGWIKPQRIMRHT